MTYSTHRLTSTAPLPVCPRVSQQHPPGIYVGSTAHSSQQPGLYLDLSMATCLQTPPRIALQLARRTEAVSSGRGLSVVYGPAASARCGPSRTGLSSTGKMCMPRPEQRAPVSGDSQQFLSGLPKSP